VGVRVAKVRDERLCWLAVRDRLERRSRRMGILGWLTVLGSFGLSLFAGRSLPGARMRRYSVAVDHVAGFLDDDERASLHQVGSVPPWFLYEVRRAARAVRRNRPLPAAREDPRVRWRRIVLRLRLVLIAALVVLAAVTAPAIWLRIGSDGRISTAGRAGTTDVVIVFGAQVAPGGTAPMPFLRGRLDVGADLLRAGRAKAILISGDRHGSSGNEVEVMHSYLRSQGVDPARIVEDPYGLDTYDTCRRAHDVYGVKRALLVSQALHLPRAVTLCRRLGIDAYGVDARCDGCQDVTLAYNTVRELGAGPKAAWEALIHRQSVVRSTPDPSLRIAADR
jgi:vancomycin permeability regulator SanA